MYPPPPPLQMADKLQNNTKKNHCWFSQKDCRQIAARSITKYVDVSVWSHCCLCFWFVYGRNSQSRWCFRCADLLQHPSFTSETDPGFPVSCSPQLPHAMGMCSGALGEPSSLRKCRKLKPCPHETFSFQTISPQVEEAIWLPCILSRKNLRYHLIFKGLKLTCVYLKTSACLTNTNMQLWFSETRYHTCHGVYLSLGGMF